MRLAHAHRVVGEVDIAVVAEELRHDGGRARRVSESIIRGYATARQYVTKVSGVLLSGCLVAVGRVHLEVWNGSSKSRSGFAIQDWLAG